MDRTRRELGKLVLALPCAAVLSRSETLFAGLLQAGKPNSRVAGVQIGAITYSYRSMPDQSAEAILKYTVDSGISAIELMGAPVTAYAQARSGFTPSNSGRGGGRAGGGGGGRGAGRGEAAPSAVAPVVPDASLGSWNGQPCAPSRRGGGGGGNAPAVAAAGAAIAPVAPPAATPGAGRGAAPTPEQLAAAEEQRKWRQSLSMDIFKDLRKMYNDAGVTIYAVKNISLNASDEELEFQFTVAKTLGATHVTAELPTGATAAATLKRVGDWALKHGMHTAYHTHTQGSMTVFDEAFAASKGNMANVDFGHFVAGGNQGGTPIDFLNKFHDRIASFHLKDRTLPAHCELNLPWGQGETPIKELLRLVSKNRWPIPATIEQEYAIPQDSDAVKEVRKCLDYCRAALA
jgi:sugar phosphate isomerase/epimerase